MRRITGAALAATAIALALAPVAQAGEPFEVGLGKAPHLTVDPVGTAHVVWTRDDKREPDDVQLHETHYCRIPRGARTCDIEKVLPTSDFSESPTYTGQPFILRGPTGTLYIVSQRYVASDVWLWESTDNGATWSAPRKLYDWSNSTDFGEPAFGPGAGEMTFTVANTADAVFAANVDGSEAAQTAHSDLNEGGFSDLDYELQAVPTAGGGLLAVENRLGSAYYWTMDPGKDPSDSTSWSKPPAEIGPSQEFAQLAGGPSGQFALMTVDNKQVIRKWNGAGFDPAVLVSPEYGYLADLIQSGTGGVGAIWRRNGYPHNLRFALSTDGGASFTTRTVARQDDIYFDLDVALADDNQGFYVYSKGTDNGSRDSIRVGDLSEVAEPAPTPTPTPTPTPRDPALYGYDGALYPGPTKTFSVSDRDKQISFQTPKTCVRPGQTFRARLTWRRKKRKGNLFVKVRRADFYIGSKRVKIDKKAPFTQVLTVTASTVRGSTIQLRARAFIKVKHGKSPTKSLRTTLKVCL